MSIKHYCDKCEQECAGHSMYFSDSPFAVKLKGYEVIAGELHERHICLTCMQKIIGNANNSA